MVNNKAARTHLLNVLKDGQRFDGRKNDEFRDIKVVKGCARTAEGSAEVSVGETKVIAGVKFSIEKPYGDCPDEGVLMVNVEQSSIASPEFEPGPPGIEAIELARVVDRGIRESKVVDLKTLCIEKGEKVWFVSVDIVTINDDGNLLDACGIAALAALQDAKFPELDEDGNVDYHKKTDKSLELRKMPLPITVYKYDDFLLLDPCHDEQRVADARLTVTTIESGDICALQKGGVKQLTIAQVGEMLDIASKKAKEIRKQLS